MNDKSKDVIDILLSLLIIALVIGMAIHTKTHPEGFISELISRIGIYLP